MKLYGAIASPYVVRVLMYAKIKGVDLAVSETPGGMKSAEHLRLNPIGKVPTMEVNGQGIAESTVMCDYLEDAYTQKSGLPKDPLDRAKSRLVARLVDLYLATAVSTFFRQMNPAKRDAQAVETASAEVAKVFGYIEHFMGPGPFVVGATPTLGDCALAPYMILFKLVVGANFPSVVDPTAGTGRLATWWKAVNGMPELKALLDEHATALSAFFKSMAAKRS